MTKNPFLNAAAAFVYIAGIVTFIFYGLEGIDGSGILAPITFLSLLVLSVLVMGYTLLLAPLELFFEKEIRAGSVLFAKTLAIFALIVALLVATLLVVF